MPASATEVASSLTPYAPVASVARRQAPSLPPAAEVRAALVCLDRNHADAVAVIDPESGAPLGILTLRDVLKRIALGGSELDLPVAAVAAAADGDAALVAVRGFFSMGVGARREPERIAPVWTDPRPAS